MKKAQRKRLQGIVSISESELERIKAELAGSRDNPLFTRGEKRRLKRKIKHGARGAARRGILSLFGLGKRKAAQRTARTHRGTSRASAPASGLRADVISALVNQGYSKTKASKMVPQASAADDFSSLFRRAIKKNPLKKQVTDRAHRARARKNINPELLKRCGFCGSNRNMRIHHVNGNESDGETKNLMGACHACNLLVGHTLKRSGIGRPVDNPDAQPARNLAQWMMAVKTLRGESDEMTPAAAVAMIRATSPNRRSHFAQDIAKIKRGKQMDRERRERRNPEEDQESAEAIKAFRGFHGADPDKVTTVIEKMVSQGKFWLVGRLLGYDLHQFPLHRDAHNLNRRPNVDCWEAKIMLCADPPKDAKDKLGRQLFLYGGNQDLEWALKQHFAITSNVQMVVLGTIDRIWYVTRKSFHNFELEKYLHRFGEEGGEKPLLLYDRLNKKQWIVGGDYTITERGIEN